MLCSGVSDVRTWLSRLTLQQDAAAADTSDHEKLTEIWGKLENAEQNKFVYV